MPLLDAAGHRTDKLIDGAVTMQLSPEQASASTHRQLWMQGGTPGDPLLAAARPGYGFGALRCAADGHAGGNVQWLGFPSGVRHVFCFAYYVKSAQAPGTLVVKARAATRSAIRSASGSTHRELHRRQADPRRPISDVTLVRSSGGAPRHGRVADPRQLDITDVTARRAARGAANLTATDMPTGTAP